MALSLSLMRRAASYEQAIKEYAVPSLNMLAITRAGSTTQRLLRWFVWPLSLSVASAAAWLLNRNPAQAVLLQMATMLGAVLLVVLAERGIPLRRDWQRASRAERRTDLTSMLVLMMVADPIVKRGLLPLVATTGVPFVAPDGGLAWFPTQWHPVLQLVLAAAIAECGQYGVHRAMHSGRWLWGLHGFHHNPTRIYWLNGFRANPLNMILHQLAGLGLLVAIGTPTAVVQMLILFSTAAAVFQHANADLRYDGWNWIFSTADLHRWHHATGQEIRQVNFGGLLTLWDIVFGTYRRAEGTPKAVGVDAGVPRAAGYIAALREAMHNSRVRRSA
jgi:sterol desaturase/sphingolipid hydroxylase (fatty acid hydroxylase superfamily)